MLHTSLQTPGYRQHHVVSPRFGCLSDRPCTLGGLAVCSGGRWLLGKLRHEASQGHSPAEERRALLLARHGTPGHALVLGAVPLGPAGVKSDPPHPDGEPGPVSWLQRRLRFPWKPAQLLQTFRYSLKINPSQHVSRQTKLNRYETYGFINSSKHPRLVREAGSSPGDGWRCPRAVPGCGATGPCRAEPRARRC